MRSSGSLIPITGVSRYAERDRRSDRNSYGESVLPCVSVESRATRRTGPTGRQLRLGTVNALLSADLEDANLRVSADAGRLTVIYSCCGAGTRKICCTVSRIQMCNRSLSKRGCQTIEYRMWGISFGAFSL